MAMKYTITCECGKKYPVETFQAGQTITCSCGLSISIPTMLKIKKLPVWSDESQLSTQQAVASETSAESVESSAEQASAQRGSKVRVLAGNRLGVFIVAILLTILFAFLFIDLRSHPPIPLQVFYKRTMFASGDNMVRRNSSPVSETDYDFYLQNDPQSQQTYVINDLFIDRGMNPAMAFIYFDVLKDLNLSENFYENFEEIRYMHQIKTGAALIALILSVLLCGVPWLMPRRQTVVGQMRGTQWKK